MPLHLAAIVAFARVAPAQFAERTSIVTYLGGGLGYILIAAMAATSFDRSARWLGARRWRLLHGVAVIMSGSSSPTAMAGARCTNPYLPADAGAADRRNGDQAGVAGAPAAGCRAITLFVPIADGEGGPAKLVEGNATSAAYAAFPLHRLRRSPPPCAMGRKRRNYAATSSVGRHQRLVAREQGGEMLVHRAHVGGGDGAVALQFDAAIGEDLDRIGQRTLVGRFVGARPRPCRRWSWRAAAIGHDQRQAAGARLGRDHAEGLRLAAMDQGVGARHHPRQRGAVARSARAGGHADCRRSRARASRAVAAVADQDAGRPAGDAGGGDAPRSPSASASRRRGGRRRSAASPRAASPQRASSRARSAVVAQAGEKMPGSTPIGMVTTLRRPPSRSRADRLRAGADDHVELRGRAGADGARTSRSRGRSSRALATLPNQR